MLDSLPLHCASVNRQSYSGVRRHVSTIRISLLALLALALVGCTPVIPSIVTNLTESPISILVRGDVTYDIRPSKSRRINNFHFGDFSITTQSRQINYSSFDGSVFFNEIVPETGKYICGWRGKLKFNFESRQVLLLTPCKRSDPTIEIPSDDA